ncbi:hypothetical protein H5410_056534 [Solanum commersonii]|uniref:Uncharacterized protein n=1 Tax=Solanum commersonii TaxID=4109 RepID=A0A9J5WMY5_SOLCO|nr:hypothetical protein H5410_056534 [Solanum commersonii]
MDVCQDLNYGAESIDLLVNRISNVILLKYFLDVLKNLSYGAGWSRWVNRPIFKVKQSPERSMDILVIWIFDVIFAKENSWTSIKTLAMEFVGPDRQTGPSSKSNETRNRFSTSFLPKKFMDVHQDLSCGAGWSRWANRPIFKVKLAKERFMNLLVNRISDVILLKAFVDVFQNLSYGAGWCRRENKHILKVKQSLERALVMDPVGPDDQTIPFSWSNVPRAAMKSVGPNEKTGLLLRLNKPRSRFSRSLLPKLFTDIRQDLSYGANWS